MKYRLTGDFWTDGDFGINLEELAKENFEKHIIYFGGEHYSVKLETEDKKYVRHFLSKLITSYKVSYTHYYLISYLYDLTDGIIEALDNEHVQNKSTYLSGNYDGTELTLVKINSKNKVGGRIFFIDETSDEIVKFYDKEGKEIDTYIGSLPFSYEIIKAGNKPKYWVYSSKTKACVPWGLSTDKELGTSVKFGAGFNNTKKILDEGAEGLCTYVKELRVDTGLDDWFIGSKEEMKKLREFFEKYSEELGLINIFRHEWFWSSSEYSAVHSWYWTYFNQSWNDNNKPSNYGVIAMRFF